MQAAPALPIGRIASVQIGRIAPLGPEHVPSAFVKRPVEGDVVIGEQGLAGDEQADLTVHGGAEKAVYGYASRHYPSWMADYPDHADRFQAGGLGENLTIDGLDEADLCVGDCHRIGSTVLQVCQPRQPCFKFALRFDDNRLPKAMVRTERSGWYYRVLVPGTLRAGDDVFLEDRPHPDFRFGRLVQIVYRHRATIDELRAMAAMAGLASSLRSDARQRLGAA